MAWAARYPLCHAACSADATALRALLSPPPRPTLDALDEEGRCALHYSSWNGLLEPTLALLAAGASVDVRSGDRRSTPLHLAAGMNHPAVVRALLAHGAALDALDADKWTPLHLAEQNLFGNAAAAAATALVLVEAAREQTRGAAALGSTHAAVTPIPCSAPPLPLAADLRSRWASHGFLALRAFLPAAELAAARAALDALLADLPIRVPPEHAFFESKGDPSTLKQLQALHVHAPVLGALGATGAPAALAAALLGPRPILQNLQYFCKRPRGGGGAAAAIAASAAAPTPPHQDGAYFLLKDPSRAVTLWLALDAVDGSNGAVEYVPGSHLGGLLVHKPSGVLGFSRTLAAWGAELEAACEVQRGEPGDLLVHHSLTIHRAAGNESEGRWRRALGFIYYAEDAEVDEVGKLAYEEGLRKVWRIEGRL